MQRILRLLLAFLAPPLFGCDASSDARRASSTANSVVGVAGVYRMTHIVESTLLGRDRPKQLPTALEWYDSGESCETRHSAGMLLLREDGRYWAEKHAETVCSTSDQSKSWPRGPELYVDSGRYVLRGDTIRFISEVKSRAGGFQPRLESGRIRGSSLQAEYEGWYQHLYRREETDVEG